LQGGHPEAGEVLLPAVKCWKERAPRRSQYGQDSSEEAGGLLAGKAQNIATGRKEVIVRKKKVIGTSDHQHRLDAV